MPKYFLTGLLSLLFASHVFCQQKPDDKSYTDSLEKAVDSLVKGTNPSALADTGSYLQIGFGIGNSLYSMHNNIINSKETEPTVVYTPSVAYFHKSGFNLTATAYLLTDKKFGVNQYAITPAYETPQGKDFDFLASYTHNFVQNVYSQYASPIQNDFYTSLIYKKPLIEPGIAIGYSEGQFKDNKYLDTTVTFMGVSEKKTYYDSTSNNLNSFSFIPSIQHEFDWYDLFSKTDAIVFTPGLMINFGSTNTAITQNNTNILGNANAALVKRVTRIINRRLAKFQSAPFQLESLALNLEATYQIGKFSIAPLAYLDYYIPSTTANKFSQIYLINFAYSIY